MIPVEHLIAREMERHGVTRLQAIRRIQSRETIRIRTIAPLGRNYRISSDAAWPLRDADGRTFAERAK